MPAKFQPVFVDIETSGTNREFHNILSLAILKTDNSFVYIEFKYDIINSEDRAMKINGFSKDVVSSKKLMFPVPGAIKTTIDESKPIITKFLGKDKHYMPCGLNVGSFDMEFMRRAYGDEFIHNVFSYRSIDLNALIFTEAFKLGKHFLNHKRNIGKACKKHVTNENVKGLEKHHALYDCFFAQAIFDRFIGS